MGEGLFLTEHGADQAKITLQAENNTLDNPRGRCVDVLLDSSTLLVCSMDSHRGQTRDKSKDMRPRRENHNDADFCAGGIGAP